MKKTRGALLLAALILTIGFSGRGASATNICVTYYAKAPVVGTRSGTRCASSPFTHTFFFQNCKSIPPAGVYACVTLTADLP
jgi:hypothetical protein